MKHTAFCYVVWVIVLFLLLFPLFCWYSIVLLRSLIIFLLFCLFLWCLENICKSWVFQLCGHIKYLNVVCSGCARFKSWNLQQQTTLIWLHNGIWTDDYDETDFQCIKRRRIWNDECKLNRKMCEPMLTPTK